MSSRDFVDSEVTRRSFLNRGLCVGVATLAGAEAISLNPGGPPNFLDQAEVGGLTIQQPAFSQIPTVGDGKWIWREPPKNETGYLEPRRFKLRIGVRIKGTGRTTQIRASTVAPVQTAEQKIEEVHVKKLGCAAELRQLTPKTGQLVVTAASVSAGQTIGAYAEYQLILSKDSRGFDKSNFSPRQTVSKEFRKLYLHDSPGIQTRSKEVRELANSLGAKLTHPWDKAEAFQKWVTKNIRGKIGVYMGVTAVLRKRVGDCEERAAVFVALCRASGIPARIVWVPNHNWSEFHLVDSKGQGHWIPVHTACYSWFGWTGAHELVLQKGDRIRVPERRLPYRLLPDEMQWAGPRPKIEFVAELQPLPSEAGGDPGPGERHKDKTGEWRLTGSHPDDKIIRDGDRLKAKAG